MRSKQRRIPSIPDDTLPSAASSSPATSRSLWRAVTLTRVQGVVATLTGIVSVTGATFSLVESARPAHTGELVAIVRAADPSRSVSDAIIEVLTTEDAIVATLTPDLTGQATKQLQEGVYVVRVRHPRYVTEAHRIQVLAQQSVEIRSTLKAPAATPRRATAARGSSSRVERAVGGGVNAVRKAFRF